MTLQEVINRLNRIGMFGYAQKLQNRTAKQWRNCESLDRNRKCFRTVGCNNISQWILWSFEWDRSPEGDGYWGDLYETLRSREASNYHVSKQDLINSLKALAVRVQDAKMSEWKEVMDIAKASLLLVDRAEKDEKSS